jgi:hypothetical protein
MVVYASEEGGRGIEEGRGKEMRWRDRDGEIKRGR